MFPLKILLYIAAGLLTVQILLFRARIHIFLQEYTANVTEWVRVLCLEKSCTFKISSLKIIQTPWTLLPFRTFLSRDSVSQVPKLCPLEIQGQLFCWLPFFTSPRTENCYNFVITVPKTASNHHITHKCSQGIGPASLPQKQRCPKIWGESEHGLDIFGAVTCLVTISHSRDLS